MSSIILDISKRGYPSAGKGGLNVCKNVISYNSALKKVVCSTG